MPNFPKVAGNFRVVADHFGVVAGNLPEVLDHQTEVADNSGVVARNWSGVAGNLAEVPDNRPGVAHNRARVGTEAGVLADRAKATEPTLRPEFTGAFVVITRDEAEADIVEAAIWYERRSAGLGGSLCKLWTPAFCWSPGNQSCFRSCIVRLGWDCCASSRIWWPIEFYPRSSASSR